VLDRLDCVLVFLLLVFLLLVFLGVVVLVLVVCVVWELWCAPDGRLFGGDRFVWVVVVFEGVCEEVVLDV